MSFNVIIQDKIVYIHCQALQISFGHACKRYSNKFGSLMNTVLKNMTKFSNENKMIRFNRFLVNPMGRTRKTSRKRWKTKTNWYTNVIFIRWKVYMIIETIWIQSSEFKYPVIFLFPSFYFFLFIYLSIWKMPIPRPVFNNLNIMVSPNIYKYISYF